MAVLSTDPITWKLTEAGDLDVDPVRGVTFVSGVEAAVQGVRTRLRLFLGEWFRNRKVGVPYYEELIGDASKSRDRDEKWKFAIAAQILDTPGIVEILSLTLDFDASTRKMTVRWKARLEFGETASDEQEAPVA